jgi:hypothetical protein
MARFLHLADMVAAATNACQGLIQRQDAKSLSPQVEGEAESQDSLALQRF